MQLQYVLHEICLLFSRHLSFDTLQPWSWGFEQLSNAVSGRAMALLKSFDDHAGHYNGLCVFGYNSSAAAAREVFKPSTDSESLVVPIHKKSF